MAKTKIEWIEENWNPAANGRLKSMATNSGYAETGFNFTLMSDTFHENMPDDYLDRMFDVMQRCPQHTFQVLTKRAERMNDYFSTRDVPVNVWLGVSVENQESLKRAVFLLRTNAKTIFLSCEPLLEEIDLSTPLWSLMLSAPNPDGLDSIRVKYSKERGHTRIIDLLDWVIVGGESGKNARPMNPDWVRSIRDQCIDAGVPFFFKQWGAWCQSWQAVDDSKIDSRTKFIHIAGYESPVYKIGKKHAGNLLDGQEWRQFPEVIK